MSYAHLFGDGDELCLATSKARVDFVAEVLGVEPPLRLVDDERCPAAELMTFVRKTGVSLDFIFAGDLKPFARLLSRRT